MLVGPCSTMSGQWENQLTSILPALYSLQWSRHCCYEWRDLLGGGWGTEVIKSSPDPKQLPACFKLHYDQRGFTCLLLQHVRRWRRHQTLFFFPAAVNSHNKNQGCSLKYLTRYDQGLSVFHPLLKLLLLKCLVDSLGRPPLRSGAELWVNVCSTPCFSEMDPLFPAAATAALFCFIVITAIFICRVEPWTLRQRVIQWAQILNKFIGNSNRAWPWFFLEQKKNTLIPIQVEYLRVWRPFKRLLLQIAWKSVLLIGSQRLLLFGGAVRPVSPCFFL